MVLEHGYGKRVRILDETPLLSLLARIGSPDTDAARLPALVRSSYLRLAHDALARDFPSERVRVPSRMAATEPRAFYDGPILCRRTRLVICAVLRAGLLPAQICYEAACEMLPPENVRLDFVAVQRRVDAVGRVTGARLDDTRIGGPLSDSVLWIPDPMGATGATVVRTLQAYRDLGAGEPQRAIALHLMVTPEAIRRVRAEAPAAQIVAARLDRGLSPPDVLATRPGTHPERERGLTDKDYVVPGAGGMGELLTNSWI